MINQPQTIHVPVPTSKPEVEIDIRRLTEEDVESLQRKDPFLYNSIPAVHRAKLLLEDVDHSEVASSSSGTSRGSSIVSRKSRVTTECHMSVLLDDLLNDPEFLALERETPSGNPQESNDVDDRALRHLVDLLGDLK